LGFGVGLLSVGLDTGFLLSVLLVGQWGSFLLLAVFGWTLNLIFDT